VLWFFFFLFKNAYKAQQTPRNHKPNDLDQGTITKTKPQKKRSEVRISTHSTINKMAMGLETLRDGGQHLQNHPRHHWTYKSNDLDYRLLQEDYKKKAVRGPKINQLTSTINKMAMGLETLRNGGQGLQKTI
jgi:hypothetical protein